MECTLALVSGRPWQESGSELPSWGMTAAPNRKTALPSHKPWQAVPPWPQGPWNYVSFKTILFLNFNCHDGHNPAYLPPPWTVDLS